MGTSQYLLINLFLSTCIILVLFLWKTVINRHIHTIEYYVTTKNHDAFKNCISIDKDSENINSCLLSFLWGDYFSLALHILVVTPHSAGPVLLCGRVAPYCRIFPVKLSSCFFSGIKGSPFQDTV